MTGNEIRFGGAKSLSEMLKLNTTLTSLDLSREEDRKGKEKEQEKK